MTYNHFTQTLYQEGFSRVERDDRLLDVLPGQTREKGIELWEKWNTENIEIIQLRLPFKPQKATSYTLPRNQIERLLKTNQTVSLDQFKQSAYLPIS